MANPAVQRSISTPWQIIYRGAGDTTDGIVESPYFLTGFDDDRLWWPIGLNVAGSDPGVVSDDTPYQLGTERLFRPAGTEMQILPLFSADNATALFQLWGFDLQPRQKLTDSGVDTESPEPRVLLEVNGAKTNDVLGEAFNLARLDPGNPRVIPTTAQAEVQTLLAGLTAGDLLQRDQNGESFAVGLPHTFDIGGWGAFMVNVPVLSAGELILAVRFRTPVN